MKTKTTSTNPKRKTSVPKSKIKTPKAKKIKSSRKSSKKTSVKQIVIKTKKVEIEEQSTIKELSFSELIPMSYDDVVIHEDNGIHSLTIAPYFTKDKLKNWFKGKGGIFSKDYRNYLKNKKEVGQYFLISNKDEKNIIRLIEDKYLEDFKSANFVDGQIGNKSYMLFKKLDKNEKLTSTYISDVDYSINYLHDKINLITEDEGLSLFTNEDIA
jgi:hypothetical protein